jgi:hypothetical protein
MAVIEPRGPKFPCSVCGHDQIFGEACSKCAEKEREAAEEKDKKEFYIQFEGLTVEEKQAWILEWIRTHRNSFHGHSDFEIRNMGPPVY